MGELNPHIALFTETMLKNGNGFVMDGYSFCGKGREKKSCGGVGILVSNHVKHLVTPHETQREIELIWISVRRKKQKPIYLGVYYGLQETRNTRNEMMVEMDKLSDEIQEKQADGEVVLFMDGNGKIGLLGEGISRNGRFLLDVFEECELSIMNRSEVCKGAITRVNRKKEEEKSAIDFLVVSKCIEENIQKFTIDEEGDFLVSGSSPSDHNSFMVEMSLKDLERVGNGKVVRWRLNAPVEKWNNFRTELAMKSETCKEVMRRSDSMDVKYSKWKEIVDKAALETVGKTTLKPGAKSKESTVVKLIRKEKKDAKKAFEHAESSANKVILKEFYIQKQQELKKQIEFELQNSVERRFSKMVEEGKNGFWKEVKRCKKDNMEGWISIKDADGIRILDPERQKARIADYYENLYSFDPSLDKHTHHEYVKEKIVEYQKNREYEDSWYNKVPSKKEITEIIDKKKNKKSTTDFPNEFLKRGGDSFVDCLYSVIKEFWLNEDSPKEWNRGIISSIYKGKGDREKLQFQRGITVSSAISMICEEVINRRMTEIVTMTQAQGGGKKGSSTRDHVFILRGAMIHAMKNQKKMFVTFYDVSKAYDRADVEDMLVTVWDRGMRGKLWRLMKSLNTELTAIIKTRHGLTREILRRAGGKQGGKNFGFLFAKMMDVLAEEVEKDETIGVLFEEMRMALLEWVDDVVTFAVGSEQQNLTLACVDEFAVKHKLKWGKDKCNVMQVGSGEYSETKWSLGKLEIDSCMEYKYLGDLITKDGKNKRNIEERENKVMAATRKVIAICGDSVINRIEVKALTKLHETCILSTLLTNCETWVLNKGERDRIQKIELWALKKLLNVPVTTPTPAIWFTTGNLLTPILIDKRQLLYLKTLLDRPNHDWTRQMLFVLKKTDIGWASQINRKLEEYNLEISWEKISEDSFSCWKNRVLTAVEKRNKELLIEMCLSKKGEKTKTKFLLDKLKSVDYQRKPLSSILCCNKLKARTLIMGLFGMLDCAANYKHGYGMVDCKQCGVKDDESHRINSCLRFKDRNLYYSTYKYDFQSIYSDDDESVGRTLLVIEHMWRLDNGKNEMRFE